MVKAVVHAKANVNRGDFYSVTPVERAECNGCACKCIQPLLQAKAHAGSQTN